jgi:hypothetical protein
VRRHTRRDDPRPAVLPLGHPDDGDVPAADLDEVEVLDLVLGDDRVAQAAREVVDRRRFPGLGLGDSHHEGAVVAAGEPEPSGD